MACFTVICDVSDAQKEHIAGAYNEKEESEEAYYLVLPKFSDQPSESTIGTRFLIIHRIRANHFKNKSKQKYEDGAWKFSLQK